MSDTSDTPRTDEARRQYQAAIWNQVSATGAQDNYYTSRAGSTRNLETVSIEFARELERENAELKERLKNYE